VSFGSSTRNQSLIVLPTTTTRKPRENWRHDPGVALSGAQEGADNFGPEIDALLRAGCRREEISRQLSAKAPGEKVPIASSERRSRRLGDHYAPN
jgi:hypothetical protein